MIYAWEVSNLCCISPHCKDILHNNYSSGDMYDHVHVLRDEVFPGNFSMENAISMHSTSHFKPEK